MNNAGLTHPLPRVPPSAISLRESLVRLNICRERDFRRCRRRLRRLARGIPAFDFIWIDALLSAGVLTPFQAKVLEGGAPDQLRLGPCILLERLGGGDFSETFVAATPGDLHKVVLKRLRPTAEAATQVFERSQRLVERLRDLENPFVVGPHFAERHSISSDGMGSDGIGSESDGSRGTDLRGTDLIVLSRYIAGPTCRELLIRRGRFPVDVVGQIARQLAWGLAALESREALHGQIRLANVRLSAQGQAVLVDAGISETLDRGLLLRSDVAPEFYEGTAPELIGTGQPKTAASELYAFGCLLWELLAGRPPFPTGDPLAKLAAHQSRRVPDIHEFAPDTPQPLAEAIRTLTERDPARRPRNFREAASRFGAANPAGERRLIQFRRQFDSAAPLTKALAPRRSSRSPAAAVVIALLIAGAGLVLSETSVWTRLSSLGWKRLAPPARTVEEPVAVSRPTHDRRPQSTRDLAPPAPGLRPIPKPNAEGIVLLDAGPYNARSLSFVGDLSIRGTGDAATLVVVGDHPLEIVCRRFSLNNVVLSHDLTADFGNGGDATGPLVAVRSQDVTIERCTFSTAQPRRAATSSGANLPPAVIWSAVEARDPDAGRIRLSNSLFLNPGPGIVCHSPPGRLEADNCLKVGDCFFDLPNWPTSRPLLIAGRHVTLRRAESLCRVAFTGNANRKSAVHAALVECAFDLTGPRAALVQVAGVRRAASAAASYVVTGSGSLIRPNVPIAASTRDGASAATPIDQANAVVEGLTAGEFQFEGAEGATPRDSAINGRSLQIPRQSDTTPGIVAARLPFAKLPESPLKWADKSQGREPLAN